MKLIHKDIRKGVVKVKVENSEDLWYLSNIIDPADLISGKTLRKIKTGAEGDRKQNIIKKPVFMEIKTEKTELTQDTLRVLGAITDGPEDIARGTHHSFNIELNTIFTITKERWLNYQLEKLKEASEHKGPKILICIFDREDAIFALSERDSYKILTQIAGDVQKKYVESKATSSFYNDIIKLLNDYSKRYETPSIILASPSFWKEELLKELKNDELKKKIVQATCSSVDKTAINEVLKRDEVKTVLQQDRITKEVTLVEELLREISKNNLAVYGLKGTEEAVTAGAVKDLLITDSFIQKKREENKYDKIDIMLKSTEQAKGSIHIISSDNDAGKKLNGLGGIGGILRYKLNY